VSDYHIDWSSSCINTSDSDSLESARLALVRDVATRFKQAIDNLTNRKGQAPLCRSQGGVQGNWLHLCDCAMLGALHRTLYGEAWYSSGTDGWADRSTMSARVLINEVERVRSATVVESRMASRKGGHHHQGCTPWAPITHADVLKSFSGRSHPH
jgi:hypothetical protein